MDVDGRALAQGRGVQRAWSGRKSHVFGQTRVQRQPGGTGVLQRTVWRGSLSVALQVGLLAIDVNFSTLSLKCCGRLRTHLSTYASIAVNSIL